MESRRRKKEHFSTVEGELTTCKDQNDELKKRVAFLEKQNFNLMNQLKRLQESVMAVRILFKIKNIFKKYLKKTLRKGQFFEAWEFCTNIWCQK